MKGHKDSSSKKEIEDGSSNKDSRRKAACGSKDLCGSKTIKENMESATTEDKNITYIVLQENMRSMNSSERIEEMIRELEGYRWDAVLLNETVETSQVINLGDASEASWERENTETNTGLEFQ